MIGFALALPHLVRVVAIPTATRLTDYYGILRGAIVVIAIVTTAGYAALGLTSGQVAILIGLALVSIPFTPVIPLSDAYALKGLGVRGIAYGPVRLWGSAAFMIANVGAGMATSHLAAAQLIWLIVGALALTTLCALALPPVDSRASEPPRKAQHLLTSPTFVTLAIAVSLIQASHSLFYGFSSLDWSQKGYSGTTIGLLWAIAVVAEMMLFGLSARLPAAFGPMMLIGIGAASAVLRWIAMALDPPASLLPVLQLLHGLSFGATHLGTMAYLARVAPEGGRATAQGDVATIMGLGGASALWLSGLLYGRYGAASYAAMAVIALAGGLALLLAARLDRRDHAP
jgi:PPP family 3-phenylpropionic acid transporter